MLLAVFVVRTAPALWSNLRAGQISPPVPTASIDRLLEPLLQIRQPAEHLTRAFAPLPPGSRIVFVSRKGDGRWDFVYSAICYLTWPRGVEKVELGPSEDVTSKFPGYVLVAFCGVPAPTMPGVRLNIGPNLTLVAPDTPK